MKHKNIEWSNEYGMEIDSIQIVSSQNFKSLGKCYRVSDDRERPLGWCGTNQMKSLNRQKFKVRSDEGWGFCTKDCFLDQGQPQMGVPRYSKDVHILDQEYCDMLMRKRLKDKKIRQLKVKPEILCVGKNKTYKSDIYIKDGNEYYLMNESARQAMQDESTNSDKWYIVGKYPKTS